MKTPSITKVTLLSIFVMSVVTAITMNSCQKEIVKPKTVNTSASAAASATGGVDFASSMIVNEANNFLFSSYKNEKGLVPKGFDSSSCVVITIDTVTKPHTRTYDYGSGCVGSDGKTRAGITTLTYNNADLRVANAQVTLSFQNYSLNGTTINGAMTFENTGPNPNGNDVLTQVGSFTSVSAKETDTLSANYQYEWLAGENSSPAANWQFSITGSVHGSSSNGGVADITITSPLIKNAKNPTCGFYIAGTESVIVSGNPDKFIDFGNPGGCSGLKSVTQNGSTTVVHQ